MTHEEPAARIKISNLKNHPWLDGRIEPNEEEIKEFEEKAEYTFEAIDAINGPLDTENIEIDNNDNYEEAKIDNDFRGGADLFQYLCDNWN